jgi:excisionase family DNA binding protein
MRERLSLFDDPGALESDDGEAGEEEEALLTVRETALLLRVNASTVRRWIAEGTLAAVKLPGTGKRNVYRIKKSTINEVLRPLPREENTPADKV